METENKYLFKEKVDHYHGKFFTLSTKKYYLESNKESTIEWECVNRSNILNEKRICGAGIIALVKNSVNSTSSDLNDINIILIENYRYPVDKKVLEFPSGIIDESEVENVTVQNLGNADYSNEDYENLKRICVKSCERELKEETGYHGKFKSFLNLPDKNPIKIFQNNFYDPWKSSENGIQAIFEIDKSLDENKNPKQELEKEENIKVHEVKLNDLLEFISNKVEKEDYGCDQHLYSFAVGLQFSNILKLNNF